jgi:hypothetical protein
MTVQNIGDGTGTGTVAYFDVNTNQYDFVSAGSGCSFSTSPTPVVYCALGDLAPEAVATGTLSLRVRWTEENDSVTARVWTGNESNTSNNSTSMIMWRYTPPPPHSTPPHPVVDISSLPSGNVNQPYRAAIGVSGGSPPYVIQLNGDSPMPPGLTLSPDGVVSGVPTAAGTFSILILVQDSYWKLPNPGPGATSTILVTINGLPESPSSAPPPAKPRPMVWTLSFSAKVRAGDYAHLSVGVTPPARCVISVRYAGNAARGRALAPKFGAHVSWRWRVGPHTPSGRWPVKIACGVARLTLHLHVTRR